MSPEIRRLHDFLAKARRYETLNAQLAHMNGWRGLAPHVKAVHDECQRLLGAFVIELDKLDALEGAYRDANKALGFADIDRMNVKEQTRKHLLENRASKP